MHLLLVISHYPALRQAVKERMMGFNPVEYCELPKSEQKKMRVLSIEEIEKFFEAVKGSPHYAAFCLALATGTLGLLKFHQKRQEGVKDFLGPDYHDHSLAFCTEDGRPLDPDNFRRHFNILLERVGSRRPGSTPSGIPMPPWP